MARPEERRAASPNRENGMTYEDALEFIKKVKHFAISTGRYQVMDSFYRLIMSYKYGLIIDRATALRKAKKIFEDSPELYQELLVLFFGVRPNADNQKNEVDREEEEEEAEEKIGNARALQKGKFTCSSSNRPVPEEISNNYSQVVRNGKERKPRSRRSKNVVPSVPRLPEESPTDNNNENRWVAHKGKERKSRSRRVSRSENDVAFVPSYQPIPEEIPHSRVLRSDTLNTWNPSYQRIPEDSDKRKHPKSEFLNHEFEIKIREKDSVPRHTRTEERKGNDFEDKRYRVDMLFHWTKSAIKDTEKLLKLLEQNPDFEIPIRIEDHLRVSAVRCIRDHLSQKDCGSVIEAVRINPRQALPILIPALKKIKNDCQELRNKMKYGTPISMKYIENFLSLTKFRCKYLRFL